ncbi:MAG: hypothetical protein M1331_02715 [Candidatus Marsarchaeota archaeon]|nr:hypothetical protein [Candidatus Marsarchaeota archaeon]
MFEFLAYSNIIVELAIIAVIGLVVFLIFKLGKSLLRLIFGIIANSILGLLAIIVLDYIFNFKIPLILPIIIATALFGLPAVGTFIIMRLFGVPLAIPSIPANAIVSANALI